MYKKASAMALWYALDKLTGKVESYAFGKRENALLKNQLALLKGFDVKLWLTDGCGRLLLDGKHIVGKKYAQRIEYRNLNFRTRIKCLARKTICFTKSDEVHDKIIGTCIERYEF